MRTFLETLTLESASCMKLWHSFALLNKNFIASFLLLYHIHKVLVSFDFRMLEFSVASSAAPVIRWSLTVKHLSFHAQF